MRQLDRLAGFGIVLVSSGVPFALFSYAVLISVPLTALGLACVILGATIALTPPTPIPKHAVRAMVEGGVVGVEALLEEFEASERAVYLPPRDGRPYVFVPLTSNPSLVDVKEVIKAPLRVITHVDGRPGLIVFPPGSEVVRLSSLATGSGLEDGVRLVLVDFVEGAESVKVVREGGRIAVEIVKPMVRTDFPRFNRVLGSLATSIAGCSVATVLGIPVLFDGEKIEGRRIRAEFLVVEPTG